MQEASPKTPRRWRGGKESVTGGLLVWNRQKRGFYGHRPHVPESLAVCRAVALAPRVTTARGCTPSGFWGAAAGCASRSCAGDNLPVSFFLLLQRGRDGERAVQAPGEALPARHPRLGARRGAGGPPNPRLARRPQPAPCPPGTPRGRILPAGGGGEQPGTEIPQPRAPSAVRRAAST